MNRLKKSYVKKITQSTELNCRRSTQAMKPVEHLLRMTSEKLFLTIETIVDALPDSYFHDLKSEFKEDFIDFISRNYIFFETNRKDTLTECEKHLEFFVCSLSGKIRARYF